MLARRFSLAALLFGVTFIALLAAIVAPIYQGVQRSVVQKGVVSVAASADGTTFAALMGDGSVLLWDNSGTLKRTLRTPSGNVGQLAVSSDGRLLAVSRVILENAKRLSRRVELWDVETGKSLRTFSASPGGRAAFSPTQSALAIRNVGGNIEVHLLDGDGPPSIIGDKGFHASFSPDGTMVAIGTVGNGVAVYDSETHALLHRFMPSDDPAAVYYDVAWSPGGQSVAGLRIPAGARGAPAKQRLSSIDTWNLSTGDRQTATLAGDHFLNTLTYLPGGRVLAMAGPHLGATFADAATLERISVNWTDDIQHVAAGVRGDRFIMADGRNVSLWDVATLREAARLPGASEPPPVPALLAIIVWAIFFAIWRARRRSRRCQTCGQKFKLADRTDTNTECTACRQFPKVLQLTPIELSRDRRKQIRRQVARIAIPLTGLLVVVLLVETLMAGGHHGLFLFLITGALLLFAVVLAIVLLIRLLADLAQQLNRLRLIFGRSATQFRLAEEVTGAAGTTRQLGNMLVWSAAGTSLADIVEQEIEVVSERLETTIGRRPPPTRAATLVFPDGKMLARYFAPLGLQLPPRLLRRSFYLAKPFARILCVDRQAKEQNPEPRVVVRALLLYHLLHKTTGRLPMPWIFEGIPAALSHDNEHHELARLNRHVLAGRAAGRTIAAAEFFGTSFLRNWRRHGRRVEWEHFAWSAQFAAQSWSMIEFLCGHGSTGQRRLAFQQFFNDPDQRRRPAAAILRHFGYTSNELFAQWLAWAEATGVGEHHSPPHDMATYLMNEPIAKVASPDTLPGERIAAIRELGELGYLLGGEALIAALDDENEEVRTEALWALECISGKAIGSSPASWKAWWQEVRPRQSATN